MQLDALANPFIKARTVNETSNGYVAVTAVHAEPVSGPGTATDAAIFDVAPKGGSSPQGMLVMPFGVGADDNTFSLRAWAYKLVGRNPNTVLWVPYLLCELACTLSTQVGVVGMEIVATERFADTIVVTYGNANVSLEVLSPANNLPAHAIISLKGAQKATFRFTTGGVATSCNALVSML